MASLHFAPSSAESLAVWREKIKVAQRSRSTPESIVAAEVRASSKASAKKNAGKARRIQTVQAYSKSAFGSSMATLRSTQPHQQHHHRQVQQLQQQQQSGVSEFVAGQREAAAPLERAAASTLSACSDLLGSSCVETIDQANRKADAASLALSTLQRAASASDEEEAEGAIESARMQLASAGYAWASRGDEGALEAADFFGGADNDSDGDDGGADTASPSAGSALRDLLNDLKQEPANDADAVRRFALYEAHAESVGAVRKALFSFWAEAGVDVPAGAAKASIEAQLKAVDGHEHLGVAFEPRWWFVYSMALQAARNEAALGRVLQEVRTKLELLANTDDCPCCLEPIAVDDEVALGCAHKLHASCWKSWSQHCSESHKTPFCPLCRADDFLEEVLM